MISGVGRPPILKEIGGSRSPYKSNNFYATLIFCILLLEVLFSGSRIADWDLSSVFVAMAQGRMPELAADRQFQLEGLLPNSIGTGFAAIGLRGGSLLMATWLTGIFSFLAVCAYYVHKNRIGLNAVILILLLTRITDTFSMWQGRNDAFFLGFAMIGVLSSSTALSTIALSLACFCHPPIAVIAFIGVLTVRLILQEKTRLHQIAVVLAAFAITQFLIRFLYPGTRNRAAYLANEFYDIVISGMHYSLVVIASCIMIPLFGLYVANPDGFIQKARHRTTMLFLAWLGLVAVVSTVLVLDHTRVATMLTFGPFLLLYARLVPSSLFADRHAIHAMIGLFAARLLAPHIDQHGMLMFEWGSYLKFFGVH